MNINKCFPECLRCWRRTWEETPSVQSLQLRSAVAFRIWTEAAETRSCCGSHAPTTWPRPPPRPRPFVIRPRPIHRIVTPPLAQSHAPLLPASTSELHFLLLSCIYVLENMTDNIGVVMGGGGASAAAMCVINMMKHSQQTYAQNHMTKL